MSLCEAPGEKKKKPLVWSGVTFWNLLAARGCACVSHSRDAGIKLGVRIFACAAWPWGLILRHNILTNGLNFFSGPPLTAHLKNYLELSARGMCTCTTGNRSLSPTPTHPTPSSHTCRTTPNHPRPILSTASHPCRTAALYTTAEWCRVVPLQLEAHEKRLGGRMLAGRSPPRGRLATASRTSRSPPLSFSLSSGRRLALLPWQDRSCDLCFIEARAGDRAVGGLTGGVCCLPLPGHSVEARRRRWLRHARRNRGGCGG